ncbi:MAG: hypothetical protein GF333_00985 [Candidatus Omnitrophica bacterium]|nr:hypothetical protein [Candidatus Omnitrophota bacterium]
MKGEQSQFKRLNNIVIAIDDWDDVFSDFDPSPLNQRTLSEDFMQELRKRYRETKTGDLAVTICAPKDLRDPQSETMVTQRLSRHFRQRSLRRLKEIRRVRLRGAMFVCFGIFFLASLTFAAYYRIFSEFTLEIVGIVLMPLGWFGIWEGFSKIVDISPSFSQEAALFEKLAKAKYRFTYLPEESDDNRFSAE